MFDTFSFVLATVMKQKKCLAFVMKDAVHNNDRALKQFVEYIMSGYFPKNKFFLLKFLKEVFSHISTKILELDQIIEVCISYLIIYSIICLFTKKGNS